MRNVPDIKEREVRSLEDFVVVFVKVIVTTSVLCKNVPVLDVAKKIIDSLMLVFATIVMIRQLDWIAKIYHKMQILNIFKNHFFYYF